MENDQLLTRPIRPSTRTVEPLTSHSVGGCCAKTCLFGCGGVLATVGVLLAISWSVIVTALLGSQLSLKKGSEVYDKWVETPIPMYFNIYLYNWTNPTASLKGKEKPIFVQMGPYVFTEHHSKKNITWNSNYTVTYFNEKQYHFLPEKSNGTWNDKVTNVNMIAMVVGWYCRNLPWYEKLTVNELLLKLVEKNLVKTDTVGNLLFDGSFDPLLLIFRQLRQWIKDLPDMQKFAFFYGKNMTLDGDGVFTMGTGQDDIDRVGILTEWNYRNRTVFRGECGRVRGSYGEELPPSSVDQEQLEIFANDMCSVIPLTKDRSSRKMGVPSNIFVGKEDAFSNATTCYCETDTSCPASGVRDISKCRNAPIMMSWPHFYLADPSYREAIVGMNPDPDKHQFVMEIAEVVSVPLSVRARMQLNLHVYPIKGLTFFESLPDAVFPMLWFSQEADVTPAMAAQLSSIVTAARSGRWVLFSGGLLGASLVLVGWVLQSRGCFGHSDDRLLQ